MAKKLPGEIPEPPRHVGIEIFEKRVVVARCRMCGFEFFMDESHEDAELETDECPSCGQKWVIDNGKESQ
jgi:predicted Zn-ribbon and HTH transcriptional regulator